MNNVKHQKGISLIELMAGMVVGVIVIGGSLSLISTSTKGQVDNIRVSRLNQDLRAMMDVMVRDIRRAGYATDDPATYIATLQSNPYFDDSTIGKTTDIALYNTDSCIVYSYNSAIPTGVPPAFGAVTSVDRFGFRLTGSNLVMRRAGATNENCTDGTWESITEPDIEITDLTFDDNETVLNVTSMADGTGDTGGDVADQNNGECNAGEGCNTCVRNGAPDPACLYVRTVSISLTGELAIDDSVSQTITEQVRIRNDKFLAALP